MIISEKRVLYVDLDTSSNMVNEFIRMIGDEIAGWVATHDDEEMLVHAVFLRHEFIDAANEVYKRDMNEAVSLKTEHMQALNEITSHPSFIHMGYMDEIHVGQAQ